MKKAETIEKEFLENQHRYAKYFLELILNNPERENEKTIIYYVQNEIEKFPVVKLFPNDYRNSNFHIALRFENEFFITVWDNEYHFDFTFYFKGTKLLKLIPLKIRTAMKKLYYDNKKEIKKSSLV